MAGFFVFGNPNGEQTSKCDDKTRNFLGSFYVPYRTGIHRKMYRRPGNEMHYVFLIYENPGEKFLDTNGRPGGVFRDGFRAVWEIRRQPNQGF